MHTVIELVKKWDGCTTDIYDGYGNLVGQFVKVDDFMIECGIATGNTYWYSTSEERQKVEHLMSGKLESPRDVAMEFEEYNYGSMFDRNDVEFRERFANPCTNPGAFDAMRGLRGKELEAAIDIAYEYERESLIEDEAAWKSYLKGLIENA